MAELSIKVTIANRVYPLKVNEHEEENVRKAAKFINEKVQEFGENFSVRDGQDLLAMFALQYVGDSLGNKTSFNAGAETLENNLAELDELVTASLSDFSSPKEKS